MAGFAIMNKQSANALPDQIIPVILAGGAGYRLKPWSRPSCPKPFLKWRGRSLLQDTLARVKDARALVLCHQDHLDLARQQSMAVHPSCRFLVEPSMKNTGPAIAAAAAYIIYQYGPQAVMLVLPSDHAIDDPSFLRAAVRDNLATLGQGILSFAIKPRGPSTRYGYIVSNQGRTHFTEKPDKHKAKDLISRNACWNSGIWMAQAATIRDAYKIHAEEVWQNAEQAVTYARHEGDASFLEARVYDRNPSLAVDCMIMEKYPALHCCTLPVKWRDLGTWPSMVAHLCGL